MDTFCRVNIGYNFALDDGRTYQFEVNLDRPFDEAKDRQKNASWTELAFHQCTNCPLSRDRFNHCPAAVDLQEIIRTFRSILSFECVTVEVKTPERTYSKRCDVQTGLRSLIGLSMATSACPILSQLRGMAYHHLPFATLEETIIRTVGAYLLNQYFAHKSDGKVDLDLKGLETLYKTLQTVDSCFKRRIDDASELDANMNAMGSLGFLAMGVTFSLDDMLAELKRFAVPAIGL